MWKFRAFRDLKWNQNYFYIDQYYLTLTTSYCNLLNTLDIDLVPPYSTRHLNFGSTGIDNGPQVAGICYFSPELDNVTLTLTSTMW